MRCQIKSNAISITTNKRLLWLDIHPSNNTHGRRNRRQSTSKTTIDMKTKVPIIHLSIPSQPIIQPPIASLRFHVRNPRMARKENEERCLNCFQVGKKSFRLVAHDSSWSRLTEALGMLFRMFLYLFVVVFLFYVFWAFMEITGSWPMWGGMRS